MNWIGLLVIVCIFVLIIWLTSLLANAMKAGRSGMGWVFLALLVSGIISGVALGFFDFSDDPLIALLTTTAISVVIFAIVLDAGIVGGFVVSLGYLGIVGAVFATAMFLGISVTGIGALTGMLKMDNSETGMEQTIQQPDTGMQTEGAMQTGTPLDEDPERIVGYSVDGPLKDYSFDTAEPSTPISSESVAPAYYELPFIDAEKYVGYRVRITRRDSVKVTGVLDGASGTSLDVKLRASGGYAILPVKESDIRLLEVYR
jgi:hypothetical protein